MKNYFFELINFIMNNNESQFHKNTKAIRVKYRTRAERTYQSRVFFPNPTLEEALAEAKDFMYDLARNGFRVSISEAKRVRI